MCLRISEGLRCRLACDRCLITSNGTRTAHEAWKGGGGGEKGGRGEGGGKEGGGEKGGRTRDKV